MTLTIRNATHADIPKLIDIFEQSILAIDDLIYSKAQKRAWMTVETGLATPEDFWKHRFARTQPSVAESAAGEVVGFIEYLLYKNQSSENDPQCAYIDGLFVHPNYQRQGVAQALYDKTVFNPYGMSINTVWVHASKLAYPFFLKQGFEVVEQQQVERHNVTLSRYLMRKFIK
ncbi:GNAT family N-acetyltransferase [Psychrobacter sp. FDAARGOS_221]|uniref:GNAT family N-acetyltransferase n=1 Tax=Psychrobacter sp. FDAARGOS_221 TaxID=1975705 RepID=UPI000BB5925F|nr:GNAT family N-acetyltransferase [Psychrobacter sp. FDAARGOS_221]PNK61363.1 GNAT family N-acetyltransferase [Psychrobacter sp. FDAARGOS_221]